MEHRSPETIRRRSPRLRIGVGVAVGVLFAALPVVAMSGPKTSGNRTKAHPPKGGQEIPTKPKPKDPKDYSYDIKCRGPFLVQSGRVIVRGSNVAVRDLPPGKCTWGDRPWTAAGGKSLSMVEFWTAAWNANAPLLGACALTSDCLLTLEMAGGDDIGANGYPKGGSAMIGTFGKVSIGPFPP